MDECIPEMYTGKIQFLRLEHGYIRSKSKIHGIRDITFYYKDLDEDLMEVLVVGSIISFMVVPGENGKLVATSIQLIQLPNEASQQSAQNLEFVRTEISSDSTISDDESGSSHYLSRKELISGVPRTPATMQQLLLNHEDKNTSKDVTNSNYRDFATFVNVFLERVLSRNYNASNSSCWLC